MVATQLDSFMLSTKNGATVLYCFNTGRPTQYRARILASAQNLNTHPRNKLFPFRNISVIYCVMYYFMSNLRSLSHYSSPYSNYYYLLHCTLHKTARRAGRHAVPVAASAHATGLETLKGYVCSNVANSPLGPGASPAQGLSQAILVLRPAA